MTQLKDWVIFIPSLASCPSVGKSRNRIKMIRLREGGYNFFTRRLNLQLNECSL